MAETRAKVEGKYLEYLEKPLVREGMCLVRRRDEGEWVLLEMEHAPDA